MSARPDDGQAHEAAVVGRDPADQPPRDTGERDPQELHRRLELVRALSALPTAPPRVAEGERIAKSLLHYTHLRPPVSEAASRAHGAVMVYVRECAREAWRKPDPSLWEECRRTAQELADALEPQVRAAWQAAQEARRRPPQPSEPHGWWEDDDYGAFWWSGCLEGTIRLDRADVPPAMVVGAVEKAVDKQELDDAKVFARKDEVVALWAPDDDEKWERDLLRYALEEAARQVKLPTSVVRVQRRKPPE